jgi:hypothetical protein
MKKPFNPPPLEYKKFADTLICNHEKLSDLTQGLGDLRNYYCPTCKTHWYKGKVWTKEEWKTCFEV